MAKKRKQKEKKQTKNKRPSKPFEKYKVEGNNLVRSKTCPKCGAGYFLAEHKDRLYCGKCHYVEYKGKPKVEEKKPELKKGLKDGLGGKIKDELTKEPEKKKPDTSK